MSVTGSTLVTAVNNLKNLVPATSSLVTAVLDQGTRLSAAESLNGVATTLTDTVKQVRDLTTGTPLYIAVNGLRTLTAGTTLTDAVLAQGTRLTAAETLSPGSSSLVTSVLTYNPYVTRLSNLESLTSGTPLTDTVRGMRDLSNSTFALVSTLLAIRDYTPTSFLSYTNMQYALATISSQGSTISSQGSTISSQGITISSHTSTLSSYNTRINTAQSKMCYLTSSYWTTWGNCV
jgi:hypothetical protein